ncbi:MAG: hypothetical protein KC917_19605, partial [Candidatus Omnitrophica bacterium]|nr:hypothetical protein [Candidatus Omnitrophota bacterium]
PGSERVCSNSGGRPDIDGQVDRTPAGANCYGQHYHLVLEEGFWKIQRSEDGEPRKNPIKPQKGRVMKASDFLGRTKPS